ncbi:MAG: family 78 glycoside hydrolase catalytic domain [Acutalibacteraceae bacterium]|nr:family 78 glycoside hydrolase catalytic domain [Acutalibacteraceae bacterium]
MLERSEWIKGCEKNLRGGTVYLKNFRCAAKAEKAILKITALGVYEVKLNGERVGDFILAPGWTSYLNRLQVQSYDVTDMLKTENSLDVTVGQGWRAIANKRDGSDFLGYRDTALIAELTIVYADGTAESIVTDSSWTARESKLRYTNIYDGDIYDATFKAGSARHCICVDLEKDMLIPQEGEKIVEHERMPALQIIKTPAGETVIDFGQNMTGYVEFSIKGTPGAQATISHGETLDCDGNFYNANYRSADAQIKFICDGEEHIYKSALTFFGFRYIRLENWPDEIKKENFTAVVVHSDIRRTGYFECSDETVNKLFKNIIWGQKSNFLDVPTDCPQRNERLGWTGDAQVFVRTASLNFDVERFFKKWLHDLTADQGRDGCVPHVVPNIFDDMGGSSAWSDAAVICPWEIYRTYGDKAVLEEQFDSMKAWIDWMRERSENGRRSGGSHFGDWLGLDSPEGSYKGSTPDDLIATAYYKYSTELFIKAAHALGRDVAEYENIPAEAAAAFRREYMENGRVKNATQTACVLALYFDITDDRAATATQLNELVKRSGHLETGFVGTPYLLHALSDNGYAETAYDLLLRREYPSWLYPISKGATTVWEHWDGIKPDGTMWSTDMNSFNHYAYGAVADWMYGAAAGINSDPDRPGFKHIIFRPVTDRRLDFVKASIDTRRGTVASEWRRENGRIKYIFTVPEGCGASVIIGGEKHEVGAGTHEFLE